MGGSIRAALDPTPMKNISASGSNRHDPAELIEIQMNFHVGHLCARSRFDATQTRHAV